MKNLFLGIGIGVMIGAAISNLFSFMSNELFDTHLLLQVMLFWGVAILFIIIAVSIARGDKNAKS